MSESRVCTVDRVTDGDTLHGLTQIGWDTVLDKRVRLILVNAPELSTPEGKAAKAFTADLIKVPSVVTVVYTVPKLDQYGRILAEVQLPNGDMLSDLLLQAGYAVPMPKTKLLHLVGGDPKIAREVRRVRRRAA